MIAQIKLSEFDYLDKDQGIFMAYDAGDVVHIYFATKTPIIFMASIIKDKNRKYLRFLQRIKFIKLKSSLNEAFI